MQAILALNIDNNMAFEYMMATHMLTFRLGILMTALQTTEHLDALFLPRHYQEAIIVYLYNTQQQNSELVGKWLNPQTITAFNDFMQTIKRYGGDAVAARDELREKYGHTYWYYSLFNNPVTRMAPK